jgi:hypothetical protein
MNKYKKTPRGFLKTFLAQAYHLTMNKIIHKIILIVPPKCHHPIIHKIIHKIIKEETKC